MGSSEDPKTPAKPSNSKPATANTPPMASQDPPPTLAYTSDWAASVQAYYGAGAGTAPAFFQPVWGGQPLMPPYGTPIAYSPMYAPAAVYAHPSSTPGMGYPTVDSGKSKSKAALDKSGEGGKATSGSGEEDASQSCGSATEGSSDTRDESPGIQENSRKRLFNDVAQDGESSQPSTAALNSNTTCESSYGGRGRATKLPVSAPGRTTLPSPATNLNIGMDIWNAPHGVAPLKVGLNTVIAPVEGGPNGVIAERQWIQDERELKRERRKQSNRESARRSRLRKQQECEELARKVTELNDENSTLRSELEQLQKVCKDLEAENQQIEEELKSIRGSSSKMNGKIYHSSG
ncbi:G-box-binding factor 1 [Apostasia shenzhenica]|uniref:G-box-binding factor 1 n=1 Tax=Apostasia shenzhenica TaxID=1088818 RepID=A0A2I0AAI4_9ASPA|nr:G-box-binding factor 1 [Apostasia shenzhenica]